MYIATREINTPEQTYQAGQEVLNPSKRMIETGTVKRVSDVGKRAPAKVPEQSTSTSAGKGKKDKAQTVKEPVKEPASPTQEEILTEDSADVEVKTEE
jgi:hypothetical protein